MATPKTYWRNGEAPEYDDATIIYDDADTNYDGESPPPRTLWLSDTDETDLDTWDDTTAPVADTWDNAADTWDSILDS